MFRKFTTSVFLTLVILAFPFEIVSAQLAASPSPSLKPLPSSDVPYESVNPPDGISYLLKRVREKISMVFAFSNERKINNYKKLVQVRLAELKFVIENKEMGYFEKSTQRYFTTVGQLTEFLTNKNIMTTNQEVREMLSSHIPILSRLRDTYNPTTAEWRFVEDDINYIKGYINSLSSP